MCHQCAADGSRCRQQRSRDWDEQWTVGRQLQPGPEPWGCDDVEGPGVQGRASRSSHCGLCPREAWEFGACGEREVGGGWCSRPLRVLGEASPSDRGPRSSGHQQQ